MSVAEAANATGLSELAIYQLIEAGDIHFVDDANHILACLSSLRGIQPKLEKRGDRNEQISEWEIQENEDDINCEHS